MIIQVQSGPVSAMATGATVDAEKPLLADSEKLSYHVDGRSMLSLAGRTLWHVPGCFAVARLLGPSCSLRIVIFHDVSDTESSFTRGIGVTTTRANFISALKFLTKHYTPVSLQEVLADSDGRRLPPRPVLVTFDDAYESVVEFAAPLCREFGLPAVFFVNAAFLNNEQLALDNLVCHLANVLGLGAINIAARAVNGMDGIELRSLGQVFNRFLPAVSLSGRKVFRDALVQLAHVNEHDLAGEAGLYLTSQGLRDLAAFNFEVGNHTYTHVNCRALSAENIESEIDRNKEVLEKISGMRVRAFSVPYGSSADLSPELSAHLRRTGHEAVFLAESSANRVLGDRFRLDRVSVRARSDAELFSEIEVLPRLRAVRNRLSDTSNLRHDREASHLEEMN
jgi:peptidoglycan/xylan/chitin deacetylase (PgdA/CDA1 family)